MAADDLVAVRVQASGINQGAFMGIPATGEEVTWTSLAIYRIACGKIAEHWSGVDAVGQLQNLGAIPEIVPAAGDTDTPDVVATSSEACAATTPAENADLVRERLTTGQRGEAAAHGALSRALGVATTADLAGALGEAFPDLRMTPDMIFAQGDRVVARWTASGTQTGAFGAFPATGSAVAFTANSISRIGCGEITETWMEADLLAVLRQIGAVTWPSTPAATPQAG